MENKLKIISGSSHIQFAKKICDNLGINLSETERIKFGNENLLIKIKENVRESDVFVIQTSVSPVSENIIELFLLLDALKYSSATRITAVVPYFPYIRSDKKDQPRISIAAKLLGDLIAQSGANRLLTMELHAPQIQGFFSIPSDQLFATKIICNYFKKRDLTNYVVVAADVGESKHAGLFAGRLNLPIAIIDKRRIQNSDKTIPMNIIGDVKGKHAIIIDDEISSGGTLFTASEFLMQHGVKSISAAVVHPILGGSAMKKLDDSIVDELIITDTIPLDHHDYISKKIKQLSVAPLFAKAIERIHDGRSVSYLIE